ncbi:MAG: C2 family cysteine protease, partial [Phycisphaerae bacterium]
MRAAPPNASAGPPHFEAMEPRLLMSTSLTPQVMASARAIPMPTAGTIAMFGWLKPGGPAVYSLVIAGKGLLTADVLAGGSGIDPYVRVFDNCGQLIGANDNASAATLNSRLAVNVAQQQQYYVLAGVKGTIAGAYKMNLTAAPIDDFGNAPVKAAAWRLNSNGAGQVLGTINYTGDVDVFTAAAPLTGTMQVSMSRYGTNNVLDSELAVLDAQGNLLATNNDSGGTRNAKVSFRVQSGATYYVEAFSHNGSTGAHALTASTTATQPPANSIPGPAPAIAPGAAVAGYVVQTADGLQLLVLGADGADTITISQTSGGIALTTPAGSQDFQGAFLSLDVYGFGGNDTIRLTNSLTVGAVVHCGNGNNQVFDAGRGADTLYAGDGNSLLVSIGGGNDTLVGGAGLVSFWADSTDTLLNVTQAERNAKSVHLISGFYQPYTTNPAGADYVSTTIAGQSLRDPTLGAGATGYRNFSSSPLFANGPQYNDIRQGYLGDCYLLASLSSLATTDPMIINQMITSLGDGTYAVRFYRGGQEVYLRLDGDLPVNGSSLAYAQLSPQGETWVALVEKAYAYFRTGANSYPSIEGGWMGTVYNEVTGV